MRGSLRVVFCLVFAAMGVLMASQTAFAAADGQAVARTNACMGCHAVDRKLVGPSFQQIAARYKGDAGAQVRLEKKVRDGGAGVWGAIPMPSHPVMNAADIHTVVGWVLAGAPSK
ncbi:c-type cytochrome [Paraburkholderia denitrificans]|uniref:C-type cytochrome n=1 Tax=Paraburkholderia denitrificans TaxID=694025 RepID=A0ABW0J8M9_9BURK